MGIEHAKQRRFFRRTTQGQRVSLRDMFFAWWPAILVVAAGFVVTYQFIKPAPPDHVVFSAGAEDGAYFELAGEYREVLARNRVRLEVRASSGSIENYGRIKDEASDVDIAFVQGGVGSASEAPELRSMGQLYYEPVWVFHRVTGLTDRLVQIKGARLAIGPEGSGTRALAAELLRANGLPVPTGKMSELGGMAAAVALQRGELDAVMLVASPGAPAVRALIQDRSIRLMSFTNSDAYNRHFPYLTIVVLPRGGVDLARNLPAHDVHLLATTANVLIKDSLHPAIVDLLAGALVEVHGVPGYFHRQGQFPSTRDIDFPASPDAERYYKSGPSFLQRFFPFWVAVFVDRMIILLVPVFALLIPLVRILPVLYDWRVSSRISKYYGQLRFLEDEVMQGAAMGKIDDYLGRLDAIESQVNRLPIPLTYNHQLYTLREHIDLVRARIRRFNSIEASPQ